MRYLPTITLILFNFLLLAAALMPRSTVVGRAMRSLVRRPALANLVVACTAFATVQANNCWLRIAPDFHDEFSFLLMADTFASGRLSNPTPPLAEHFESPHTIVRPTYASKYPVMNGLALAFGQVLSGNPYLGVQLSFAMFCALGCWMMQGFVPPRWAFVGGLLLAMHPYLLFSESENWIANCWGGSMAASGAAILYGSIARLRQNPRWPVFAGIGLGLIVLANSRPYEGLVASLPAGFVFFRWLLASLRVDGWSRTLGRISPLLFVLLMGAGMMAVYFKAVTGNPLRMPYLEHDQQYAMAPSFWFQDLRPTPAIYLLPDGTLDPLHERRYRFHLGYEVGCHEAHHDWLASTLTVFEIIGIYYVLPVTILLIGAGWTFRSAKIWLNLSVVLSIFAATLLTTWSSVRYVAPLCAPMMLLAVQGLRVWFIARPFGTWASRILLFLALCTWFGFMMYTGWNQSEKSKRDSWNFERARIQEMFEQKEGKHLIFIDPEAPYETNIEYVYNRADIPNAKVVWARSFGTERDEALRAHFPAHQVWLFQPWEPKLQRLE